MMAGWRAVDSDDSRAVELVDRKADRMVSSLVVYLADYQAVYLVYV